MPLSCIGVHQHADVRVLGEEYIKKNILPYTRLGSTDRAVRNRRGDLLPHQQLGGQRTPLGRCRPASTLLIWVTKEEE
ncbi:MAG: hypothetical protein JO151_12825 [Verrucomicrobia bacterium]|nr:hypothetical protein [Verrucomicrobiota bacterium]